MHTAAVSAPAAGKIRNMKKMSVLLGVWLGGLTLLNAGPVPVSDAGTNRVGIYDSRAVAYAWFWSAPQQAALKEKMDAARAAQKSGDKVRFQEFDQVLRTTQDQMHREVFSTAPAVEALAQLRDKQAEIARAAGVRELVSKWDASTLRKYAAQEQVDVTDQLVSAFLKPTAQQAKIIAELRKSTPVPPEKCEELIRQGKM